MKNENRAAFGRAPEPINYAFELPAEDTREPDSEMAPAVEKNPVIRIIRRLAAGFRRRRNAMALQELNDDQLKDIGISRCQTYGGYSRYRQSGSHALERQCR